MSYTPLKDKLRAAAAAYAPLTALIGTTPARWWNVQRRQGSTFPCIAVRIVSNPPTYAYLGTLAASYARVQFTAYDTDPQRLEQVDLAIQGFVAQYNGAGLPSSPVAPNYIMNSFDGMEADIQPPAYTRVIDMKVFDNPNVS